MSPARPFSVMAKPVGSHCNLRCGYCYYLDTPAPVPRMSEATLARYVEQYIAGNPGPQVNFVWHGGEPTLACLDFYRRAVRLQQRFLPAGWECWNNLQTNGVLLDDEWCQFLAENRFDVGISIDGPAWLHDAQRPNARGVGSYSLVVTSIERLLRHGIQPDLLCTVTSATAEHGLETYRSLRALNTGWVQFIPIVRRQGGGVTPDSVGRQAYNRFLIEVFDEWVRRDAGRFTVQLFAETARTLAGGTPAVCWLAPECGRALVVEADGAVYSCDHFVTPDFRLGEITDTPLADLANSPTQDAFGAAKADLPRQCRDCPWLRLCNGGCPKDRFAVGDDGEPGFPYLCTAEFFAHAVPVLLRFLSR